MSTLRRMVLACAGMLAAAPTAFALNIAGLPEGMCALDPAKPAEKVAFDTIRDANKGSNELLAVFADCAELDKLRQEKLPGLVHYGTILEQQLPGRIAISRSDYLQQASQIYSLNGALVGQAISMAQDASGPAMQENMLSGAGSLQAQPGKVLYHGSDVLIIGMTQQHTVNGKTQRVASTAGITLIDGGTVSVNLYAPVSEGHDRAQEQITTYVPTLIGANE